MLNLDDTIAALASAGGASARGMIRLSGPGARGALDGLFAPHDVDRWKSAGMAERHAGRLQLERFRLPVDAAVCLWPTGRSYTGQPAAELHLPGSPPLLEAALGALYAGGARPAGPGEFTLRAFLAGRIDLVQAEAVLGVIDADDQPRLQTALAQLAGGISGRIAQVQHDLLNLLADLEAGLDFVEDDIEFISRDELLSRVESARSDVARLLAQAAARMLSSGRRRVVLAGLPNAGKSTLFNALAGREAALVSGRRGTTRDYLSAECEWNGGAVELIDTAGWELGADGIGAEAQQRRARQLEQADLILWCTPADLSARERSEDLRLQREFAAAACPLLSVQTKSDRAATAAGEKELRVSAVLGTGLRELTGRVASELTGERSDGQELVGTTAARCRESLNSACAALDRAQAAAASGAGEEIVAVDLRDTLEHLGRILGSVYTDDILDRIFSRFCIGK